MRGYFAVGAEGISKPHNLGAIMRTANAFDASYVFTIAAHHKIRKLNVAYLFGPEWGSLSEEALAACDHVVRIPTKFCVNVSIAAALIMYDRQLSMGSFPDRPVRAGGPNFVPEESAFQKSNPIRKRRGR